MPLRVPRVLLLRTVVAGAFVTMCALQSAAQPRQAPKADPKPDPGAQAQAMAQQQEIQSLVRIADQAMLSGTSATCPTTPAPPSGSTAKCSNGDWSTSTNRSGTCSGNTGVTCWVCPGPLCNNTPTGYPSDFPIQFQNDFLKAQGTRVWVPITLTVDPAKLSSSALTLYLRVVPRGMTVPAAPAAPAAAPAPAGKDNKDKDKDKKKDPKGAAAPAPAPAGPAYPFEDASFMDLKPSSPGQPLRIARGIGVPAGSYDLYIVLHERSGAAPAAGGAAPAAAGSGGKTSVLKQALDVPNYASGELAASTVILAERVDQLTTPITPDQQSEHPYAFGQTEIVVSPDKKFKKSQELIVLLQIYNPMITPEKKFNLEATYTFFRQEGGTEKRFNSTEPQTFSAESMGAAFDPSGNSSIQAGQGVPLTSFPEGGYRLEIKITDKLSAKVLTQNVNFTVTP